MEESRKGGNWKLKSIDLLRDGNGTRKWWFSRQCSRRLLRILPLDVVTRFIFTSIHRIESQPSHPASRDKYIYAPLRAPLMRSFYPPCAVAAGWMCIHRCGISFEANLGKGFQYLAPVLSPHLSSITCPRKVQMNQNGIKITWKKNFFFCFFFFQIISRKIEIGIFIVNVNFPWHFLPDETLWNFRSMANGLLSS